LAGTCYLRVLTIERTCLLSRRKRARPGDLFDFLNEADPPDRRQSDA